MHILNVVNREMMMFTKPCLHIQMIYSLSKSYHTVYHVEQTVNYSSKKNSEQQVANVDS